MTGKETDTNTVRQIRIRKHLDDWFLGIVVVFVLVGAVGAVFAYQTHTATAVETEEERVGTWNEQPRLSHHAEVVQPNPLYQQGQILSNQPLYFTRISPELRGTYAYSYGATGSGEVDVQLETRLQIQSVDSGGDPYWQLTEQLNQTYHEGLSPEENAVLSFEINVSDAVREIERVESGLGASVGTTEVTVLVTAHVTGMVNDERVATTHQGSLDVEPDGETYGVDTAGVEQESHDTVRTVETPVSHGPVESYGPFGLLLGSFVGIVGLGALRRWGRLPPSKRELALLAHTEQRAEFDDWISPGTIPEEIQSGQYIELDSLEALVDVAIDTNSRVIEDSTTGTFIVAGENWHYLYTESHRLAVDAESSSIRDDGDDIESFATTAEDTESSATADNGESSAIADDEGLAESVTGTDETLDHSSTTNGESETDSSATDTPDETVPKPGADKT